MGSNCTCNQSPMTTTRAWSHVVQHQQRTTCLYLPNDQTRRTCSIHSKEVMTLETPHDLAITPEKASNSSDSVEARSHDNKENRSPDYQANDGSLDLAANARDQKANDLVENLSSGKGLAVNKRSPASPPKPDEVETFIDGQLNGSQRLLTRLKTDLPFRRRYFHTIWVCWGFVVLGWMVGLLGPTFPDLRLIAQEDLETASWIFTTGSIGYLLGSLAAGIIYDKFSKLLLILCSIVLMAVTTGVLPLCRHLPLMLVVRFINGLGSGGLDTGGNADIVSIWDEEGRPYMQAVHFCFAFGGILSPLLSEPFMAKKECITVDTLNETGTQYSTNETELYTSSFVSVNVTDPTPSNCTEVYGETRIHISYLISAIIVISAAIPFLIMYINTKLHNKPHVESADKSNMERPDKLPFRLKMVLLVLLSSLMLTYCAVEDAYAGFLMTYCIKQLGWEKTDGSVATSLYWAAFSFGRFCGIFLIKRFKPTQLLFVYLILLCGAFVAFYITTMLSSPVIWFFIPFAGFSMSIVFPCIFTWTEESILNVTGKISSMFLISASSGLMLNPIILGYLMDNFTPLSFVYLLFSESVLCLLLFLLILFLVRTYVEKIGKNNSNGAAIEGDTSVKTVEETGTEVNSRL